MFSSALDCVLLVILETSYMSEYKITDSNKISKKEYKLFMIHYSHVRRYCNTLAHSLVRWVIFISQMQTWMEDVLSNIIHVRGF